jgi:peptide/nickel transport system ATP-binding protein
MSGLLKIAGLDVRFGATSAVRRVDLELERGETLALVGESGSGKSTCALALLQLLPPTARVAGSVFFEGRDLLTLGPADLCDLRGSALSMIFQDPMTSLNPVLTVGEQIVESLRLHTALGRSAARARAIELLEMVEIPDAPRRARDFPHQFSGGQRQRVMIAMAVACRPRLLVADEPTTALDTTIEAKILELLHRLKTELSMGLLLITHDLGLVHRWADRVAVMYRGAKVEEAPAARIFARPQHPYTQGLLEAALSLDDARHYRTSRLPEMRASSDAEPAEERFAQSSELTEPPPAHRHGWSAPVTRASAIVTARPTPRVTPPVLELVDIRTRYVTPGRIVDAVDGVSLRIEAGETVGLVGESGCGKSTLAKTIVRLLQPASGRILLDGADITRIGGRALRPYRRRVQVIFQDSLSSLNPRQNVFKVLDAALEVNGVRERAERLERIRHITGRVGLAPDLLTRYPHELSGGQRQRVGIARALVLRPALVICDEPVSSLDVSLRAQILNLLAALKDELGLAYLFISHDLSVVRYIADRVLVMNGGRIVESGDHRSIWTQPANVYTQSLIKASPSRAPRASHASLDRDRAFLDLHATQDRLVSPLPETP